MDDRKRQVAFPPDEYEARIGRVRSRAARQGFDVLLLTEPKNIYYLTGYDAFSSYVPQALLVSVAEEGAIVLVLRQMDVPCAWWTTYLDSDSVIGYGEEFIMAPQNAMSFVGAVLAERGWSHADVGVELDSMFLSPRRLEALQRSLPQAKLRDASLLIDWIRCIKSHREIAVMREAGIISDHAMSTALSAVAPGVHEAEVAARTHAALVRGVDGIIGSGAKRPMFGSGERTDSPHLAWFDDHYREGQPATFELGGLRHNYAAGLARTVYLGHPPSAYRALDDIIQEGMSEAMTQLRSGVTAEQVELAWRRVTAPHGCMKSARIGYSIGISFPHSTWVEPTISLASGDTTVLQPNMVLHLMLAVWKDRIGHALSETFVITDDEPESLSHLPRSMIVKD